MTGKARPIRFNDWTWERIERAALHYGISGAEFVRQATMVAVVLSEHARGETYWTEYHKLLEAVLNASDAPPRPRSEKP